MAGTATQQQIDKAHEILRQLNLPIELDGRISDAEQSAINDLLGNTLKLVAPNQSWAGQYTAQTGQLMLAAISGMEQVFTALDSFKDGNIPTLVRLGLDATIGAGTSEGLQQTINQYGDPEQRLAAGLAFLAEKAPDQFGGWKNFPESIRNNPSSAINLLKQIKADPSILEALGAAATVDTGPTQEQLDAQIDAGKAMASFLPEFLDGQITAYDEVITKGKEALQQAIDGHPQKERYNELIAEISAKSAELNTAINTPTNNDDPAIRFSTIFKDLKDTIEAFEAGEDNETTRETLKTALEQTKIQINSFKAGASGTTLNQLSEELTAIETVINGYTKENFEALKGYYPEFFDSNGQQRSLDIIVLTNEIESLTAEQKALPGSIVIEQHKDLLAGYENMHALLTEAKKNVLNNSAALGDNDPANDNWETILTPYIKFLQENPIFPEAKEGFGVYTAEYSQSLKEKLALLTDSPEKTKLLEFHTYMQALLDNGAYLPSVASNGLNANDTSTPETLSKEAAKEIMNPIFKQMGPDGWGRTEINQDLDDAAFGLGERAAFQAFILDLQRKREGEEEAMIVLKDGESALYSSEFRAVLEKKLTGDTEEAIAFREKIKERYFKGNDTVTDEMVAQIVLAMNTYAYDYPSDIPGMTANVNVTESDLMARTPDLTLGEQKNLRASLDNIPNDEWQAINGFIGIMTGFGIEDFMAEDFTPEQIKILEETNTDAVFAEFFNKILQESETAIADGRSELSLEEEMQHRLLNRINSVLADNGGFSNLSSLRVDMRQAITAALSEYETENPDALQNAATTFVAKLPSPEEFMLDHGFNTRRGALLVHPDWNRAYGSISSEISGIFGHVAADKNNLEPKDVNWAMQNIPTLSSSIGQILGSRSALTGQAAETAALVWDGTKAQGEDFDGYKQLMEQLKNAYTTALSTGKTEGPYDAVIVETLSNETYLLTTDTDGTVQARYLDLKDINRLDQVPTIHLSELTNADSILIRAASARYEQANIHLTEQRHQPVFFDFNGDKYVVGLDKLNNELTIKQIDPDFFSLENAQRIESIDTSTTEGSAALLALHKQLAAEDKSGAYAFLRENYPNLPIDHSKDRIFAAVTKQIGRPEIREIVEKTPTPDLDFTYPEGTDATINMELIGQAMSGFKDDKTGYPQFGPALDDATLNGLLGYDPAKMFELSDNIHNKNGDIIIHGMEPQFWLAKEGNPFFNHNVLATFKNGDEIVTVSLPRSAFHDNPLNLQALFGRDGENGNVWVADRFTPIPGRTDGSTRPIAEDPGSLFSDPAFLNYYNDNRGSAGKARPFDTGASIAIEDFRQEAEKFKAERTSPTDSEIRESERKAHFESQVPPKLDTARHIAPSLIAETRDEITDDHFGVFDVADKGIVPKPEHTLSHQT